MLFSCRYNVSDEPRAAATESAARGASAPSHVRPLPVLDLAGALPEPLRLCTLVSCRQRLGVDPVECPVSLPRLVGESEMPIVPWAE